MKSEVFCSEKFGTLTGEYEQVAVDLRETQERLRVEWEVRRSCRREAGSLEVRLEEARAEHARLQTSNADFEQRCGFTWRRGSCERSSRSGREEVRIGDQLFIERDRKLAEVRSQPAELQTLFHDVSHQLYTECKALRECRRPSTHVSSKARNSRPSITSLRSPHVVTVW